MSEFVKSLRRLYETNKITKEKIEQLFKEKKINETEKQYILGKE